MNRTKFLDTLLAHQKARNDRGRRLAKAAERADALGQRRAQERALVLLNMGDPSESINRLLDRTSALNHGAFLHYDRAARLFELSARELMRT